MVTRNWPKAFQVWAVLKNVASIGFKQITRPLMLDIVTNRALQRMSFLYILQTRDQISFAVQIHLIKRFNEEGDWTPTCWSLLYPHLTSFEEGDIFPSYIA